MEKIAKTNILNVFAILEQVLYSVYENRVSSEKKIGYQNEMSRFFQAKI